MPNAFADIVGVDLVNGHGMLAGVSYAKAVELEHDEPDPHAVSAGIEDGRIDLGGWDASGYEDESTW